MSWLVDPITAPNVKMPDIWGMTNKLNIAASDGSTDLATGSGACQPALWRINIWVDVSGAIGCLPVTILVIDPGSKEEGWKASF